MRTKEGVTLPMSLKAGDRVVLPGYGGTEMKLEDKDCVLYSEDEIVAKVDGDA
jgi:chaperonin GroES